MADVNDFVDAIVKGNLIVANDIFSDLMQDRLTDALDGKKIELAQEMLSVESVNDDDDEEVVEDDNEEGYAEDDEFQYDS